MLFYTNISTKLFDGSGKGNYNNSNRRNNDGSDSKSVDNELQLLLAAGENTVFVLTSQCIGEG